MKSKYYIDAADDRQQGGAGQMIRSTPYSLRRVLVPGTWVVRDSIARMKIRRSLDKLTSCSFIVNLTLNRTKMKASIMILSDSGLRCFKSRDAVVWGNCAIPIMLLLL
jgi:hypothetical protein